MTSTAQVQANRANAQNSTGPRTPEGKAVAAQNAVRHGLLAQQVVVKGEDPGEFEGYRQQMRAELAPAGPLEEMLAQRIVHLSRRLRRAERLQAAAFDKVENQTEPSSSELSPEDAGKMLAFMVEQKIRFVHHPGPPPGRKVVQDFNQERVLDRLLVYERRIEHSLYRTMAELRRLRKEGFSGMGVPPMTCDDASGQSCPEVVEGKDGNIHGWACPEPCERDAHATELEGGTANADGNESRQTNPIGAGSDGVGTPDGTCLQEESCQTNPIGAGASVDGTANNACQTNPMQEPLSTPNNTPPRPRPARKFPNTVKEETYDSYLGRWVWTGYIYDNKDSDQADSGRRQ